jgi:hypothetical protein
MRRVQVGLVLGVGFVLATAAGTQSGCRSAGNAAAPAPLRTAAPAAAQPADISGTYTLVSVNGSALPYTMTHEPPGVRVTSGSFRIDADGTCTSDVSFVLPSGEAMSRPVSATWTRDGTRLTMSWQGAGVTNGTVEGDTFTMDNEGQIFVYRKSP